MNAAELLADPEVARYLERHQGAADEIRAAAEQLATASDGLIALKKVLPALGTHRINVFLSYKTKDAKAAQYIVDLLNEYAAGKLKVWHQNDFTVSIAGRPWRDEIRQRVRIANWFILLLPDPSDEFDWCLFETGLFEGRLTSADRLFCLHHPLTDVPDPIGNYHHIKADEEEVIKFLKMVYVEDNPVPGFAAINPAISKRIPEIAKSIVSAITAPKERRHLEIFEPWIKIQLQDAKNIKTADSLDAAQILQVNGAALQLFDFIQPPHTFGELRTTIVGVPPDRRWLEELFHVVRKIDRSRRFSPIQAVLQSPNGKIYRPILHAVERDGVSGPVQAYEITFIEDVTSPDTAAMPKAVLQLATLLRFAFRFRWEVLERFRTPTMNAADVKRLSINLQRITTDWESRGAIPEGQIPGLFNPAQASRLQHMIERWNQLSNHDKSGELDVAIEKEDVKKISTLLNSVVPINQEFLEMAADRFAEMIGEVKHGSAQ